MLEWYLILLDILLEVYANESLVLLFAFANISIFRNAY